jgi:tetratricopeptide (TPR) repeat protein
MSNKKIESKTRILYKLRREAGINQTEAGKYFGLTGKECRNSVSAWENNRKWPADFRRTRFIEYLWDLLGLRHKTKLFLKVWKDVMQGVWEWDPLQEDEFPDDFPTNLLEEPKERPPFEVVFDTSYFIGREDDIQDIKGCINPKSNNRFCVLYGMAGIGKSMLAAHIAKLVSPWFPDGVLWKDLGDLDPLYILANIARSFDKAVSEYPDLRTRSRIVGEILAQKKALLILDDVQKPEQVRYLLPPSTGNTSVIVTTRITDIPILMSGNWLEIKPFSREKREAIRLFIEILGEKRVHKEIKEYEKISELMEYLPFALAICSRRMFTEPYLTGKKFLELYQEERSRLNHLVFGDWSIRVSFNLSFEKLSRGLKEFFVDLGAFGGTDFDEDAAAYICGCTNYQARHYLGQLHNRALCMTGRNERYRLHTLVREYVREKRTSFKSNIRMSEYYKNKLNETKTLYFSGDEDFIRGLELFDLEWSNIKYGQQWAFKNQNEHIAVEEFLSDYAISGHTLLEMRHPPELQYKWHKAALDTARRLDNKRKEGIHLNGIGMAYFNAGSLDKSIYSYKNSVKILDEINDEDLLLKALNNLGLAYIKNKEYEKALSVYDWHLPLAKNRSNHLEESNALGNLGLIYKHKNDLKKAVQYQKAALEKSRSIGDNQGICGSLIDLSEAYFEMEDFLKAKKYCEESINFCRKIGNIRFESIALVNLAKIHKKLNEPNEAIPILNKALEIEKEIGSSKGEGDILVEFADTYLKIQEPQKGIEFCRKVFDMSSEIDDLTIESYAHLTMSKCSFELGEIPASYDHLYHAENMFSEINFENSETRKIGKRIAAWKKKLEN